MECFLTVYEYTALPTQTISGGTSPDRSDEFRQAAAETLPVKRFGTEAHPKQPELFGDILLAELEVDRLRLNQYMAFIEEYASRTGTDDLEVLNTGIDAETRMDIQFPRPLADADVESLLKLEITSPRTDMQTVATDLESEFEWITSCESSTAGIAVCQHLGGPNDWVLAQTLELIEGIEQYGIDTADITIVCSVIQRNGI